MMNSKEGYIRPNAHPWTRSLYERGNFGRPGQSTPPKRKDQRFSLEEPRRERTTQAAIAGTGEKTMGMAMAEKSSGSHPDSERKPSGSGENEIDTTTTSITSPDGGTELTSEKA